MWPFPLLMLLPCCAALLTHEPPVPITASRNTPTEGFIDVRLHHFDASNTDTFQMRYFYNPEFSSTNEHIVIFVGGEWEISPGWVTGGLGYELAQHLHAGLFYTEHRYYGQTRPTNTTTVTDLRFLTVDQALADLAQFIQYVRSDQFYNGQYRNAKVSLIGCSYAGSMVTWMRLVYPHLVNAAFSDSGPLYAQEDFPEYLELITEALSSQGGEECVASIEEAMQGLTAMLETNDGPQQISSMFNTCTALQATSPLDLATFFWFGITETFAYLVQYATPGDITAACAVLTNANISDPVQRLASWIGSQPWTQPCIEARYEQQLALHTNIDYDSPQTTMRLWTYQTCVEFGWYQTTSGTRQPFLSTVPLEYFHQMCKDFFSSYFDESRLRYGIERSNTFFGGWSLPDHVVSVVGGHDPWSPMGPNATHGRALAPVYVVPGISHCRAVQSTAFSETQELAETKEAVLRDMYYFASGDRLVENSAGRVALASSIALISIAALL